MAVKRTRKQKKLRGGFLTKARRGVIGNWWGKCDGMKHERLKTRCLLDKERSFYEAHFPDPMAIYKDDANKKFKEKLTKKRKEGKISEDFEKFLDLYASKAARDAARLEERLREDDLSEEEQERLREEEENKNLITIQLQTGPYTQNIEISRYATVNKLKEKIANELNLSIFQLYYKNGLLKNDSILHDLGIENKSKLQLHTLLHHSNEVWHDAELNSSTDED